VAGGGAGLREVEQLAQVLDDGRRRAASVRMCVLSPRRGWAPAQTEPAAADAFRTEISTVDASPKGRVGRRHAVGEPAPHRSRPSMPAPRKA